MIVYAAIYQQLLNKKSLFYFSDLYTGRNLALRPAADELKDSRTEYVPGFTLELQFGNVQKDGLRILLRDISRDLGNDQGRLRSRMCNL